VLDWEGMSMSLYFVLLVSGLFVCFGGVSFRELCAAIMGLTWGAIGVLIAAVIFAASTTLPADMIYSFLFGDAFFCHGVYRARWSNNLCYSQSVIQQTGYSYYWLFLIIYCDAACHTRLL
jgi:hypothetical protein